MKFTSPSNLLFDTVFARLEEEGIDPVALSAIPATPLMFQQVVQKKWTVSQFIKNAKKLAVINPNILMKPVESIVIDSKVIK